MENNNKEMSPGFWSSNLGQLVLSGFRDDLLGEDYVKAWHAEHENKKQMKK